MPTNWRQERPNGSKNDPGITLEGPCMWVVRVGGNDGELRPWHYIYVYSIENESKGNPTERRDPLRRDPREAGRDPSESAKRCGFVCAPKRIARTLRAFTTFKTSITFKKAFTISCTTRPGAKSSRLGARLRLQRAGARGVGRAASCR